MTRAGLLAAFGLSFLSVVAAKDATSTGWNLLGGTPVASRYEVTHPCTPGLQVAVDGSFLSRMRAQTSPSGGVLHAFDLQWSGTAADSSGHSYKADAALADVWRDGESQIVAQSLTWSGRFTYSSSNGGASFEQDWTLHVARQPDDSVRFRFDSDRFACAARPQAAAPVSRVDLLR